MKIVHILADASLNSGGATYATYRLHEALKKMGFESIILTPHDAAYPGSILAKKDITTKVIQFIARVVCRILIGHSGDTGLVPSNFYKSVNEQRADVIIVHYIKFDVMSVSQLRKLNAPIIMYHHDLWPVLGLQPYPGMSLDCGCRTFFLKLIDLISRKVKFSTYRRLGSRLIPAGSSRWVCDYIARTNAYCIATPLRLPLLLDKLYCENDYSRKRRNGKFVILNGANGGLSNWLKGGDRLLSAIRMLPDEVKSDIELVVFGCDNSKEEINDLEVRYVGRLSGIDLARQYCEADLFAFPSRQETFGQTKLEALACGTPVIAFNETACAEGIVNKVNGWVSPPDDIKNYADGILWFYELWKNGGSLDARLSDDLSYANVCEVWKNEIYSVVKGRYV